TVITERVPHVSPENRIEVTSLGQGFWRVVGRYGYMEHPNVPELMSLASAHGVSLRLAKTSYYLSRETIIPSDLPGMALWRERLFGVMVRNAVAASAFFGLKP